MKKFDYFHNESIVLLWSVYGVMLTLRLLVKPSDNIWWDIALSASAAIALAVVNAITKSKRNR